MQQFVFPTMDQRGEGGVGGGVPIYFRLTVAVTQAHGLQVN